MFGLSRDIPTRLSTRKKEDEAERDIARRERIERTFAMAQGGKRFID